MIGSQFKLKKNMSFGGSVIEEEEKSEDQQDDRDKVEELKVNGGISVQQSS